MKLPREYLITFLSLPLCNTFRNSEKFVCSSPEEEDRAQLFFIFIPKEGVKSWRISFKRISVDDTF
jgi:hypothetical protein